MHRRPRNEQCRAEEQQPNSNPRHGRIERVGVVDAAPGVCRSHRVLDGEGQQAEADGRGLVGFGFGFGKVHALPPFDRLCKTGVLSPARGLELETLRRNTNPMLLRRDIQNLIDQLYALPVLKEGVVEDVRLALFDPQAVLV